MAESTTPRRSQHPERVEGQGWATDLRGAELSEGGDVAALRVNGLERVEPKLRSGDVLEPVPGPRLRCQFR